MKIELDVTKEELEFMYFQLSTRLVYFKAELKSATQREDMVRVEEARKALEKLERVREQLVCKL